MFDEEKSWWKKKGFYACACVLLIGVMAIGAVAFRNAKMKNSQKMLAEIEKEIPDTEQKTEDEEDTSIETSKKVTPVPQTETGISKEEDEKKLQEKEAQEKEKEKEAQKKEAEKKKKAVKKAAKKEAQKTSAKLAHSFDAEKGLLWPVKGEILMKYSMDKTVYFKTLEQYKYNPGLLIAAEEGTEVKASADGKVLEVKTDDDYGTVITMDPGNDYRIVYGQIKDAKVKAGDEVKEGDLLAVVAEPTKYFAEEGSHLFLQIKQGKDYVDPLLLLR